MQKRTYRQVSIVGLVKRRDWSLDGRVVSLNYRLKALCMRQGIGFVEADIDRVRMLGRDGVHLNWRGCDRVARTIFNHSCSYLNFV